MARAVVTSDCQYQTTSRRVGKTGDSAFVERRGLLEENGE